MVAAAVVALLWANGPAAASYASFWARPLVSGPSWLAVDLDLKHFVNEILMVYSFVVIGIEAKRSFGRGSLQDRGHAIAAFAAGFGGLVSPIIAYLLLAGGGDAARGWGIGAVTGIPTVLGVVGLLGDRLPSSSREFYLALAVFQDTLALVVIALIYSDSFSVLWAGMAFATLLLMVPLSRCPGVRAVGFVLVSSAVIYTVRKAGFSTAVGGLLLGLLAPSTAGIGGPFDERVACALRPWAGFLIVPVFVLANAGISLDSSSIEAAVDSPIMWAVLSALLLAKPVGTILGAQASKKLGLAVPARGSSSIRPVSISVLSGMGFSVSLFVAATVFDGLTEMMHAATVGILVASFLAALLGWVVAAVERRILHGVPPQVQTR